jgi:hypothetical protein
MKLRLALIAALTATTLGIAGGALAHAADPAKVEVSRHQDGPWRSSALHDKLRPGETTSFYIRVKNTSDPGHTEDFSLYDAGYPSAEDGYRVKWFKGRRDITHQSHGPHYDFSLKHGKSKVFRVQVHDIDTHQDACVIGEFDAAGDSFFGSGEDHVNGKGPCFV